MIEDSHGNIYTDYDFIKKTINQVNINVKSTEILMKKMNSLVCEINDTIEFKYYSQQLKAYYNLVKHRTPCNNRNIEYKIEECIEKMLALYKEYFFIQGFEEGKKSYVNKVGIR